MTEGADNDLRTDGDENVGVVPVYVVDEHNHARAALIEFIDRTSDFVVVGSSGSAPRAISEIVALQPRVVVLDGRVGDRDGLDVCRQLGVLAPQTSCVILSAGVGLPWGAAEAERAGAAAFLLKEVVDFPLIEVIGAIASGTNGL